MLIPLIKKDLTIVKGYTLGVVAIAFGLPLLLAWRQPQMGGMISLLMAVLISSVAFNLAISEKENQYPKATALLSSTPYTKGKVTDLRIVWTGQTSSRRERIVRLRNNALICVPIQPTR